MKRSFHRVMVVLCIVLAVSSIGVLSASAKEQGSFEEFRLTAGDPSAEAEFGRSVAIDGDLVAVGEGGDGAIGAVYLYRRHGMVYVPEAKLDFPEEIPEKCPGDFGNCSEFGRSVTIQGNTVLVGARFAPVGSLKAGAVYVFRKHGDLWLNEDKIVSPNPQEGDNFGRALAIQGNLLVVTARKSNDEQGAAYLYIKKGGSWVYTSELVASGTAPGDYFGQSVALQGGIIAIGARNADPEGAGALYVFCRSKEGWEEIAKMTPPGGEENDQFGFTVAMSGNIIAVGARRSNPEGLEDAGAVYLYSVKGNSVEPVTRLTPSDAIGKDEFGQSVAIAGDVIAVGAWKDDKKKGSIHLFRREDGNWIEIGKVTASDRANNDEFGYSLAAFGNLMVTGAHKADGGAGAAYVLPLKF